MKLIWSYKCKCTVCAVDFARPRNRGNMEVCSPCQRKARVRAWKDKNPGRKRALNQKWAAANYEKDRVVKRAWELANAPALAQKAAEHRARKFQATPVWADRKLMVDVYRLARIYSEALSQEFHVDHIYPLNSPLVCGLHTYENMQILTGAVNRSKSNRIEGNP